MVLKELQIRYVARPDVDMQPGPIGGPTQAAAIGYELIGVESVEVVGLLLLDTRGHLIAWHVLSRGSLDSAIVHPREVVKAAVLANAASVIVLHNHPSGDPTPSPDDQRLHLRIKGALDIVGIPLYDFIIVGDRPDRFYSAQQKGIA